MKKFFERVRILPQWIVVLLDMAMTTVACILAYFLIFDFSIQRIYEFNFLQGVSLYVLSGLLAMLITQSYSGIIRYTSLQDGIRIVFTMALAATFATLINFYFTYFRGENVLPYRIIVVSFLSSAVILFAYRLYVRYLYNYYTKSIQKNRKTLIFGAGQSGLITKQIIDHDKNSHNKIVGFLEDDSNKIGKVIGGVNVYSAGEGLENTLKSQKVQELIIAIQRLPLFRKNEIVNACLKQKVKIKTVPSMEKWVNGELSVNQIRTVNIKELLGRDSIELNNLKVQKDIDGKCILITGAAGSIGSEIVRQVNSYNPKQLILVDQGETPLYEVDREIRQISKRNMITVIADVTNADRMDYIFKTYKPDIVFHAAAYKHVPMMENNPSEAIYCNVSGTKVLADLSVKYNVRRFVMISTDKAVNPTSVMGASKRIAEIYVQTLNNFLHKNNPEITSYITTRFGNVLGSNGSVIPLFEKQIRSGGPLTVTHPEVTRYFMTIPEACQLVLEASTMGKGGEIFIFDMGVSVKIFDLAKKMIQLSGLELGKDIEIVFTGLREGEKLYEELLTNKENTMQTHHSKIMIAKNSGGDYSEVKPKIDALVDSVYKKSDLEIVSMMKDIIPEFISNISKFEVLDQKKSG